MSSPDPYSLFCDLELDRLSAELIDRAEKLGLNALVVCQKANGTPITAARRAGKFDHPMTALCLQAHIPFSRVICQDCRAFQSHCTALAEALPLDSPERTLWLQDSQSSPSTGEDL